MIVKERSDATITGWVFLFLLIALAILGAWLWPYTLNTWLVFIGKPASIVWWQGALLGVAPYVSRMTIPAAIGTWFIFLFL